MSICVWAWSWTSFISSNMVKIFVCFGSGDWIPTADGVWKPAGAAERSRRSGDSKSSKSERDRGWLSKEMWGAKVRRRRAA